MRLTSDRARGSRRAPKTLLLAAAILAAAAGGPGGRALALAPEAPAGFAPGPIVSGLPWRSGASPADSSFARWRGRKLDETVIFVNHPTWDAWLTNLSDPSVKAQIALTPQPVVSIAMFPRSEFKQFAACARGDFDGYLRQVGAILKRQGAVSNGRLAILRLGWEANIGSAPHPWGVDTLEDARGYQKCFRRWVGLLRPILPGAMFEWTNAKVSKTPGPATITYPGDAYADLWGLHYYDAGGEFGTKALWDAYYGSSYKGGPQGLGAWLTAAAAAGKRLAVPEWGVRRPDTATDPGPSDDPFYVRKMFATFRTHAATIAYENYFNRSVTSRIFPDTEFPKAAAEYRALWSAGP